MLRFLTRRLRLFWWSTVAAALWANRRDVMRWFSFLRRAASNRTQPLSETIKEARVRAAVSADPMLRRDPAIDDLSYDAGVVTLRTSAPSWPDRDRLLRRLRSVPGVTDVTLLDRSFAGS
ncbi:MAG TPA: hypothetical protein VMS14_08635 [Ilumatobacteraceae bacterium]|nr:hypothetical protein [Ilumatobacteraceae bacterium]HUC33453.1 hypothetical protein [Ilumatobacteraceae bacterium]